MGINFRKSRLEEKDLGIIVTKDLKPSVQCSKAAAKVMQDCRQVLRIIKRNFVLTDAEDLWICASSLGILCISLVTLFEKGC